MVYISIHATFEPTSFPDFPFLHSFVSFRVVPGEDRVFVQESYEQRTMPRPWHRASSRPRSTIHYRNKDQATACAAEDVSRDPTS